MSIFLKTRDIERGDLAGVLERLKVAGLDLTSVHSTFFTETRGAIRESVLSELQLQILKFYAAVSYPRLKAREISPVIGDMLREPDSGDIWMSLVSRHTFAAKGFFPSLKLGRSDGRLTVRFSAPAQFCPEAEAKDLFSRFIRHWHLPCTLSETACGFLAQSNDENCELVQSTAKEPGKRDALKTISVITQPAQLDEALARMEAWNQDVWAGDAVARITLDSPHPRRERRLGALHKSAVDKLPDHARAEFSYLLEAKSFESAFRAIDDNGWKVEKINVASFTYGSNDYANIAVLKGKDKLRLTIEASSGEVADIVRRVTRSL